MPRGKPLISRKPTCHPDLPYYALGLCKSCYTRPKNKAYRDDPARIGWNASASRICRLRKLYDLTPEEYDQVMSAHPQCAICEIELTKMTRVLDHCHETGQVRKPLCRKCNSALGLLNDSASLLLKAACYLLEHRKENQDAKR